jgi:hypothetical protein
MKSVLDQLRLLLAEKCLAIAVTLAPRNDDGVDLMESIRDYLQRSLHREKRRRGASGHGG